MYVCVCVSVCWGISGREWISVRSSSSLSNKSACIHHSGGEDDDDEDEDGQPRPLHFNPSRFLYKWLQGSGWFLNLLLFIQVAWGSLGSWSTRGWARRILRWSCRSASSSWTPSPSRPSQPQRTRAKWPQQLAGNDLEPATEKPKEKIIRILHKTEHGWTN